MRALLRRVLVEPCEVFRDGEPSRDGEASGRATGAVLGATVLICLGAVPVTIAIARSGRVPEEAIGSLPSLVYAAGEADVAVPGLYALLVAVAAALPVIVVGLSAALFYGLSWPVASSGSLRETVAVAIWGLVPQTLVGVPMLVVLYAAFLAGVWPLTVQVTLPARVVASRPDPSLPWLVLETVGALSVLWTGWIWTRGLAVVRGTTPRRAAAAVAVPLLFALVLTPPGSRLLNWLAVSLVGGGDCPC